MKKSASFSIALWITMFFVLTGLSIASERGIKVVKIKDLSHGSGKLGEYKALIIGINDYKSPNIPDLETAVKDAETIAGILQGKYGFKVELLLEGDATKEAIYRNLRKLAESTKPNDSVLIYFAGHGDLDRTYNDGWWIPVDAVGGNPLTYFENGQVQKAMRSMKARHVLLISDSCYSGTLFGKARNLPPVIDDKYYLNLYNEKSRWGMTSGNKTPVSDKGIRGHSVFAYQLIKELGKNDKPFLSTQEIYTRIAPVIANNSEQTPLCRPIIGTGDQGGEFVFVASVKDGGKLGIPKTKANTVDKEMLFWQSIQNSESPVLYEAYLKTFPNGVFAPIAKERIEALRQKDVVASIPPEILKSRLFVKVEPKDARVRILNIKPKFQQGIELEPGRYHVEVSSSGYDMKRLWIKLEKGEDRTLHFTLERRPVPEVQASIQKSPKPTVSAKPSSRDRTSAKEGNFISYSNGIVQDTRNGLEWIAGPDKDTSWNEARSFVQNLTVGGGGWRMPTLDELGSLYEKGSGSRNRTALLKVGTWWIWSNQTKGTSFACTYEFIDGKKICFQRSNGRHVRALAVRSQSKSGSKAVVVAGLPKESLPSRPASSTSVTKRNGVYVAYSNGIVKDTKNGLEWIAGPDKNTNWKDAKSWVTNLSLDGGRWRMPTTGELQTLYIIGLGNRNMTPLLKTTGWWVWSSETKDPWYENPSAMNFRFKNGRRAWGDQELSSEGGRVFAVRSR